MDCEEKARQQRCRYEYAPLLHQNLSRGVSSPADSLRIRLKRFRYEVQYT